MTKVYYFCCHCGKRMMDEPERTFMKAPFCKKCFYKYTQDNDKKVK